MRHVNLDLDVLRSFVAGVELGNYARAADHLGRSTSAISAQLKKLEDQAGTAIFRKAGRSLALTEAGETLLAYARRLLELNDEAVTALGGVDLTGQVRFGVQEDLGETLLPDILGRFARAHPKARIEARLSRNADLLRRLASAELDVAITWGDPSGNQQGMMGEHLADVPMRWIGAANHTLPDIRSPGEPVALVMFEAPCLFRTAATQALDRAGISWRVAVTSSSLSGLWAAIAGGLGVTLRTPIGLPAHLRALEGTSGLPPALPSVPLLLHRTQAHQNPAIERLSEIMRDGLREPLARRRAA